MLHHVPPNMAEISLHKRQRIHLIVFSYYDLVYGLSAYGDSARITGGPRGPGPLSSTAGPLSSCEKTGLEGA